MAVVKTYGQLVALRTIVGVLEAGFAPGILLILSSWYKKEEQSKRFALYISAAVLSGAFGGIIAGAITGYASFVHCFSHRLTHFSRNLDGHHGLRGWEWLFVSRLLHRDSKNNGWCELTSSLQIVEGVATCGWAVVSFFILPDFPSNTKRLSERERNLAVRRLQEDNGVAQTEDAVHVSSGQALLQAVRSWKVWILVAGYMVIVGSSTLSYFYPTLVAGLGYSAVDAQFMVVPIYAVAFVCVIATGYFGDKFPKQRGLIIAGWLTSSLICAIAICLVYGYKARYALLVIMAAGLWSTNGCALSYAASTFGDMPRETRAVSLALVNALGNLAQIYGYDPSKQPCLCEQYANDVAVRLPLVRESLTGLPSYGLLARTPSSLAI
jgi:MFS family permease